MRIIAGEYRGRIIRTCSGPGYRPATGKVRESLFSMLESRGITWKETDVLDLFAGSGSLGIESLSRGARKAVFVDKNSRACDLIRLNVSTLLNARQRSRVVKGDALVFAGSNPGMGFNLVFVDPPYGQGLARPAVESLLKADLVRRHGLISAELESGLSFEAGFHPELEIIRDRTFGQTRILMWKKK